MEGCFSIPNGKTVNIIAYVVLYVIAILVCRVEHRDVKCPTDKSTAAECESEGGMPFSHTRPLPNDTCNDLLKKVYKAVGAERASIKWRRALFVSVIIMTLTWLLVGTPGRLPDWKTMYLSVIISYVIIFGVYNYYSYHVYGIAEIWARDAITMLKDKGCVNATS
jgi:hypothetical protein